MSLTLRGGNIFFGLGSKRLLRHTLAVATILVFLIPEFNFRAPIGVLEEIAMPLANAEVYHSTTPTFLDPDPGDIVYFGMAACAVVVIAASATLLIRSSRRKQSVPVPLSPPLSQVSATASPSIITKGALEGSEVALTIRGDSHPDVKPSTGFRFTIPNFPYADLTTCVDSVASALNEWFPPQASSVRSIEETESKGTIINEGNDQPITHPRKKVLRPTAPSFIPRQLLSFPKTQVVRISPVTFPQLQSMTDVLKDSYQADFCGPNIEYIPRPSVQQTQAEAPCTLPTEKRCSFPQHASNPGKPRVPPYTPSPESHQQSGRIKQSTPQQAQPILTPPHARTSPSPIISVQARAPAVNLAPAPSGTTVPSRPSRWGPLANPPHVSTLPSVDKDHQSDSPSAALPVVLSPRPNAVKIVSPLLRGGRKRARGRAARARKWAEAIEVLAATLEADLHASDSEGFDEGSGEE